MASGGPSVDDCIACLELAAQSDEGLSATQRARVLALAQQLGTPCVHDILDAFDLPLVSAILARLDNRSYGAAACACRTFAAAAALEETFEALSRHRWTGLLGCDEDKGSYTGPYKSWKDRVLDDNREHAVPTLDFRPLGLAADWLGFGGDGQTHGLLYRCKVMALQCHHLPYPSGDDEIVVRVHFDAWGESDLRDPLTSSLGLPEHEFRIDRAESSVIRSHIRSSQRARGHLTFKRRLKRATAAAAAAAGRLERAEQHVVGPFSFVNSNRRTGDYSLVQLASKEWHLCTPIPIGPGVVSSCGQEDPAANCWTDLPSEVRERWGV